MEPILPFKASNPSPETALFSSIFCVFSSDCLVFYFAFGGGFGFGFCCCRVLALLFPSLVFGPVWILELGLSSLALCVPYPSIFTLLSSTSIRSSCSRQPYFSSGSPLSWLWPLFIWPACGSFLWGQVFLATWPKAALDLTRPSRVGASQSLEDCFCLLFVLILFLRGCLPYFLLECFSLFWWGPVCLFFGVLLFWCLSFFVSLPAFSPFAFPFLFVFSFWFPTFVICGVDLLWCCFGASLVWFFLYVLCCLRGVCCFFLVLCF